MNKIQLFILIFKIKMQQKILIVNLVIKITKKNKKKYRPSISRIFKIPSKNMNNIKKILNFRRNKYKKMNKI